jgi:EAL domain-containing protein (putative c-di-GMP-specific phosphodiesterase class I)
MPAPAIESSPRRRQRVEHVLRQRSFRFHCQPIVHVDSGQLVGVEALARFPLTPPQPPEVWFSDAHAAGMGSSFQLAAVELALEMLEELARPAYLAINLGAEAIAAPELVELLRSHAPERVVLELTEHLRIDDYPQIRAALRTLRALGTRLAIDDTGAGFASLAHLVNLAPDLIKLDRQFTRGIDLDPARRALATALVRFGHDTGAEMVAEGIETAGEFQTVRELGIPFGQGYFIAPPAPLAAMPALFPA